MTQTKKFVHLLIAACVTLACSVSCARVNHEISDVRIASLAVVPPKPATSSYPSGVAEQLLIKFDTSKDLFEFAQRTGFHLAGEVTSCDKAMATDVRLGGDYVRLNGVIIGSEYGDKPPAGDTVSPYRYSIQVPIQRDRASRGSLKSAPFNLRRQPMQLCLRLRGGDMSGAKFESNIAKIPKAMLEKALLSAK